MQRRTAVGEIYHVLNRGVDKRKIFMDDQDRLRFIHDLFEFNDTKPPNNLTYFFRKQSMVIARPYIGRGTRRLLVDIMTFCLMTNHYHLLLRPRLEGGLTKFMKKLNMGYAKYFNEKYKRSGALFEGRYKAILVNREPQFLYLPHYIHLNPLDLIEPKWREGEIKDFRRAMDFLKGYRWSSFLDYTGQKNFPSVTSRELLLDAAGGVENYKKEILEWLKEMDLEKIQNISLE